jgi:hypothetical protein
MEIGGRRYELTMTSGGPDIDGVTLELVDVSSEPRETVADVVYLDADGSFTLRLFRPGIPPEVLAWLEAQARRQLPRVGGPEL